MFIFKLNGKRPLFEIDVHIPLEKLVFGLDFSNAVKISNKTFERQAHSVRQTLRS